MAVSRLKTWTAGETLTAADLNSEFNNVLNNGEDLGWPASKNKDVNGFSLLLDDDQDTNITSDTDDRIDFAAGGFDAVRIDGTTASSVNGFDLATKATGVAPQIKARGEANIGIGLLDSNGNEALILGATASAVNEVTITNAATGNGPTIVSTGETNVSITVSGKGTGAVIIGQATSTDIRLAADQPIGDSSGNELVKFSKTASAINEITVTNAAISNAPSITASGDDTNISLNLVSKGTGVIQANGATVVPTLGTEVATTSGTSVSISTTIPSWAKIIHMTFEGVSTNGTSQLILQIGDSGGLETTGYSGGAGDLANAAQATAADTSGFALTAQMAATRIYSGIATIILKDAANFTWAFSSALFDSAGAIASTGAGVKSLTAALDRVSITTKGGTDTFDAGSINILYE